MSVIERPGARDSTARWQSYADWLEAEVQACKGHHEKSINKCRDRLEGAVETLKLIAASRAHDGQHAIDVALARNALEAMGVEPFWRAQSDQITTSRTQAQTTTCPRCGAAPGQPCTGARGKPRESMHRERHQALGA